MNAVDIVLVVILALCALRGYWRGFFRELFGLLGLFAGALGAISFAATGADYLQPYMTLPAPVLTGISFAIIFIVLHTAVNLIGVLLDRVAKAVFLRGINRVAGAVFATGKGAVVTAMVLLGLHLSQVIPELDKQVMSSRIGRPMVLKAGDLIDAAQAEAPDRT
jgi:membrane protein required for colicin V production